MLGYHAEAVSGATELLEREAFIDIGNSTDNSDTSKYAPTRCSLEHILVVSLMMACASAVALGSRPTRNGDMIKRAMQDTLVVACVGDSITYGDTSTPGMDYPSQLQRDLRPGDKVLNFGHDGATIFGYEKCSTPTGPFVRKPYNVTHEYKASLKVHPDIVVIMLGTNNAASIHRIGTDSAARAAFQQAYTALIQRYKALPSSPRVVLVVPPPLLKDGKYGLHQNVINSILPKLVHQVAYANNISQVVDAFQMYVDHCPLWSHGVCDWTSIDGTHPSDPGYTYIAFGVAGAVNNLRR